MTKPLIKICGVHDPDLAAQCIQAGVDYVGVMRDSTSHRLIDIEQAKRVSLAIKKASGQSVLITNEVTAESVADLCETLNIDAVQLSESAHAVGKELPAHIKRFYAFSLTTGGFDENRVVDLKFDDQRDFLVLESGKPGHGVNFCHDTFTPPKYPYFIAGGMTVENINSIVKRFKPTGVDVSSGVEKTLGIKDIDLVKQFIENAA